MEWQVFAQIFHCGGGDFKAHSGLLREKFLSLAGLIARVRNMRIVTRVRGSQGSRGHTWFNLAPASIKAQWALKSS